RPSSRRRDCSRSATTCTTRSGTCSRTSSPHDCARRCSAVPNERKTVKVEAGTASRDITPWPEIEATQTAAASLTEDIGYGRSEARDLTARYGDLHQQSIFVEWRTRTVSRGRAGMLEMLDELADLGLAWRDIARLIDVSVPAVQKWRRGAGAPGERRPEGGGPRAARGLLEGDPRARRIGAQ